MPSTDHTVIPVQTLQRGHAGRFLQGLVGCHDRGRAEGLGWKLKTRPRQGPKIVHAPRDRNQTGSQIIRGVERFGPESWPRAGSQGSGGGGGGAERGGAASLLKLVPKGAERSDGARRRPGGTRAPAWPGGERPRAGIASRSYAAGTHGTRGGAAGEGGAQSHSQGPQHLQSAVAGRWALAATRHPGRAQGKTESTVSRAPPVLARGDLQGLCSLLCWSRLIK